MFIFFYGDKALVFGTCPCADGNVKVLDGLEGQVRWYPTFWLCVEDVIPECFLNGFMGWLPWCPSQESMPSWHFSALTRLIDQGPDERQQSECRRRICSLFFAESKLWCMGKQRTLSEPGETDGEQWTDRAQSSVATCHGLADIFWVQRNFSSVLVFNNHSGGLFITSLGVSSHLCWE